MTPRVSGTSGQVNLGPSDNQSFGHSLIYTTDQFDDGVIKRYTTDGQPDTAFSADGVLPTPSTNPNGGHIDFVNVGSMFVTSDGGVILNEQLTGRTPHDKFLEFQELVKIKPDGSLRLDLDPGALGDDHPATGIANVVAHDAIDKRVGRGRFAPHRDRLHA
jgi:hypothetical protein